MVHLPGDVFGAALFGEHHRHAELLRGHAGDADARRLNGQNLVDPRSGEQPRPLPPHGRKQLHVHLVVEKAVHLEHLCVLHNAVPAYALLQLPHSPLPFLFVPLFYQNRRRFSTVFPQNPLALPNIFCYNGAAAGTLPPPAARPAGQRFT